MRRRSSPAFLLAPLLGAALLLAACGINTGAAPDPESSAAGVEPLVCVGPATAVVEGVAVTPMELVEPQQLPVTVADITTPETGVEKTITDTSRLLALDQYGTLATTVYALGLGDQLVGRDLSTGIPELADLPLVGNGGHDLNAEAILALNPSLILTDHSIGPYEVKLQLEEAGIPIVYFSEKRSRETIIEQVQAVADALGISATGEKLATELEAEIIAAEAEVKELAPRNPAQKLRMVFLYLRGQAGVYQIFGEGSGADDLIEALGGFDVATEGDIHGMIPLNAEALTMTMPDMYLMMSGGLDSIGGPSGLAEIPGVADTPAGRNQCVVDMSDTEVLSFGPQYPDTLRALAKAIYEQAAPTDQLVDSAEGANTAAAAATGRVPATS